MPEDLIDKLNPPLAAVDAELEADAAGGAPEIPQVSINRATVAELERRKLLQIQTAAVVILAVAAVLSLIYLAKLILVVILVSILLAFVLAPVVDFLVVHQVPRAFGSFLAVLLLVSAACCVSYVSYSRAIDFAHELPTYKAKIKDIVDHVRHQAEELENTTETVLPSNPLRSEDGDR